MIWSSDQPDPPESFALNMLGERPMLFATPCCLSLSRATTSFANRWKSNRKESISRTHSTKAFWSRLSKHTPLGVMGLPYTDILPQVQVEVKGSYA